MPNHVAQATLETAWKGGVRYFDTSPWYGLGLSELRVGQFLRERPRDQYVLSTKVGRLLSSPTGGRRRSPWTGGLTRNFHYDYSYDGIMRSFEDSLQRLGVERIDILYIHDLDIPNLGSEAAVEAHLGDLITGGFRALESLREQGVIAGFGAGVNEEGMIPRLAEHVDMDIVLYALRYSLAEHESLEADMAFCLERNIRVAAAGVYSSGLYATGPAPNTLYNYREPSAAELERARSIQELCERHHTSLAAAAIQFPIHHPSVVSVVVGANTPGQAAENCKLFGSPVPDDLWNDLKEQALVIKAVPLPGTLA
jgi:D-threo-aldose 1-dehydrogenase